MRLLLSLLAIVLLWTAQAHETAAETVVLGLSSDKVEITTRFEGSEILIFGAIQREEPIPEGPPLEVVVTVSGPLEPVMVRFKQRRFGIWVNTEAVEVDLAPSYYAIASSGPLDEVMLETENLRHKVSIPRAIRSVGAPSEIEEAERFRDALIRIRTEDGQYRIMENAVDLREQTLFQTAVSLPASLTEGAYETRIFLLRDGAVVSLYETEIDVQKVGLERWLFELSRNQPLLYGLMSLSIAIFAGWSASAIFRLLRS